MLLLLRTLGELLAVPSCMGLWKAISQDLFVLTSCLWNGPFSSQPAADVSCPSPHRPLCPWFLPHGSCSVQCGREGWTAEPPVPLHAEASQSQFRGRGWRRQVGAVFLLACPLGTLARAEGFCLKLCQAQDDLEAAWKESLQLKSQKCVFGKCVGIWLPSWLHFSVTVLQVVIILQC